MSGRRATGVADVEWDPDGGVGVAGDAPHFRYGVSWNDGLLFFHSGRGWMAVEMHKFEVPQLYETAIMMRHHGGRRRIASSGS